MGKESKTFLIGRKADKGTLVSVEYARAHKKSCIVERMPKKGFGDTK